MVQSASDRPFLRNVVHGLFRLYRLMRAGSPRRCRFYPTCSQYMLEAMEAAGFWHGFRRGLVRILKCHPWHPGGYDPVIPDHSISL